MKFSGNLKVRCFESPHYAYTKRRQQAITTDKFKPNNDIDLVIDIDDNDPISYAEKYFN